MVDPTGLVDLSNAGLYAARGKWDDAALTAAGIVPYAGDAAKLAKLRKFLGKHIAPSQKITSETQKNAIRKDACDMYKALGINLPRGIEVHHRFPIEWAHLLPGFDINHPLHLVAVPKQVHGQISGEWTTFRHRFKGRTPTLLDVVWFGFQVDLKYRRYYIPLQRYLW